MAKSYPDIGTFTSGQILTAATMNQVGDNLDNQRVPASCEVRLSANVTGYSSGGTISWAAEEHDTDAMWAVGDPTKIFTPTVGLYSVYFSGRALQTSGTTVTVGAPVIKLNGSTVTQGYYAALTSGAVIYAVNAIIKTTAVTDYFTFAVEFEGGTAYTLNGGSTRDNQNHRAVVAWLGQVS